MRRPAVSSGLPGSAAEDSRGESVWWLFAIAAVLVGWRPVMRLLPPQARYLSARKRRAMRQALAAFAREYPDARPDRAGSWVYLADGDKCFVFVQHSAPHLHPPCHAGYVAWHDGRRVDHLGGWQFHWGTQPPAAVHWYESRRAAAGGWPEGPVAPYYLAPEASPASEMAAETRVAPDPRRPQG
jgi:hypothetical protein